MLLKETKLIRPSLGLSPQRSRSKTPSHPRPSSQTPTIRKKFTPTVNKSFICYKDKSAARHNRAASFDRSRDFSAKSKQRPSRSLKNSGKVLISTREVQPIDSAKGEMHAGNYEKAVDLLNKLVKTEGMNLEAVYSRGVSYMHLHKYELAIKDFSVVMELDPAFDKQLYIALYMCYSYVGKAALGLKALNKGLRKFSNFSQGFLMRGQIYNKAKKYEKALRDFNRVLNVDKNNIAVIIHIAESYIGLKEYDNAVKAINIAVNRPDMTQKALCLKVKMEFELGKFEGCMKTIGKVSKAFPTETSVFYYKGLIYIDQQKWTDAALCFEQVIQGNSDNDLVNQSLLNLGRIKIKERDFYGALHTFERSLESGQTKELKAFHNYTEGVICLMKRKLEEGITVFSEIIPDKEPLLKDFFAECYENRGFAQFSLRNYKAALADFNQAKTLKRIEKASEFNMIVSEALILGNKGEYLTSVELLKSTKELFPRNIMPLLCRASIMLKIAREKNSDSSLLDKAESLVEKALKSREPESEVFFFKSILSFFCKDYVSSLENAKKAIEKADENIAMHYINRAFSYICLKKYEEAIQDLTICLQLKEDIQEVYIYRSICAFLQDDLQLAIEDLKTAQEKFSKDIDLQFKIAKLLTIVGYPKESLEILDSIEKADPFLLCQNHLSQNSFKKAKNALSSLPKSSQLTVDQEILTFLGGLKQSPDIIFKSASLATQISQKFGKIFTKKYAFWMAGVILLYNNDYSAASNCFQTVLEILHDEEPEIFADSITIEEENCEILYNLALCSLSSSKDDAKANALMIFDELSEVLNEKHKGQLLFLSALLQIMQKNKKKAEKLLKEAVKADQETLSPFLDDQEVHILPLHTSNEFSSIFPLIPINVDQLPTVYVRPAIVLPHPIIEYSFDDLAEHLLQFFTIETITPRPEAPWLLRVKGSIQFTDGFIEVPDLQTEEENVENKKTEFEGLAKSQNIFRQRSFLSEKSMRKIFDKENLALNIEQKIKFICND